jgi:SP family sugar:H+ symporter-like MFS transporter
LYRGKADKAERALVRIHKGSDNSDILVSEQLAILNKSRAEEAESSSAESKWSDLWSE